MARGDHLLHRAHADHAGAEQAQHAHLCGRLVAGPQHAGVDALVQDQAQLGCRFARARAQVGVVRARHVGEAWPKRQVVGADEAVLPREVQMVADGQERSG
jgi:hypothetical protein